MSYAIIDGPREQKLGRTNKYNKGVALLNKLYAA